MLSFYPPKPFAKLFVLTLSAWSHCAIAGVEVFTIAGEPVINVPNTTAVIELDAAARLDARISQDLPSDPVQAKLLLQSRMHNPEWQRTLHEYGQHYQGIARAWMLGIEKVPAVVVDSRYVVYGETNVAHALAEIERAHGNHP